MPLVNFANLDFDQIRSSIRDYLRSNSNFTDYDFEGSNLSTIIDILAYNTYITSYNANMITNEVFIDSATIRENVVSLARNIGYTPRSRRSAQANISFFVDTSGFINTPIPEVITLNKGPVVSSDRFSDTSYNFSILDDITAPVLNGIATFNNVLVYEGTYLTTHFTVDAYNPNQRFILPNPHIDTNTIRVIVRPSETSTVSRRYNQADSIFGVNSESPVFWVQETEDERYELIFGDGVFGRSLESPNYIEVSYLVSNAESANGVGRFSFIGRLTSSRETSSIRSGISLITTNTPSYGGQEIESVQSIKNYASRIYASQNRAVTASDYEALIPTIYPETESVSVFGGEELNPPRYGRVYISIKPINGSYLSNLVRRNIRDQIRRYSVVGIVPEIIDLKYLYIEPTINGYYNTNLTRSSNDITTIISESVRRYSRSPEINRFGARFKYSKFLKLIDDSSDAITSNITTIVMRRDLRVMLNSFAEYEICFGNRFYVKNHGHSPQGGVGYNIKSSGFTVSGISGTVYLADTASPGLQSGTVNLIQLDSRTQPRIVRRNVGSIDYIRGEINLSPINITSTVLNRGFPLIEISVVPYSNDVIGLQDLYLQLDYSQTIVVSKPDNISSGNDITGSNYIVSSSFANGELVRGPVILANANIDTPASPTQPNTPNNSY